MTLNGLKNTLDSVWEIFWLNQTFYLELIFSSWWLFKYQVVLFLLFLLCHHYLETIILNHADNNIWSARWNMFYIAWPLNWTRQKRWKDIFSLIKSSYNTHRHCGLNKSRATSVEICWIWTSERYFVLSKLLATVWPTHTFRTDKFIFASIDDSLPEYNQTEKFIIFLVCALFGIFQNHEPSFL